MFAIPTPAVPARLLFEDTEGLTPGQIPFARKRSEFTNADELTNLEAVVKAIHPTIMIGTSTQPGAFTEEIVKEMAAHTWMDRFYNCF